MTSPTSNDVSLLLSAWRRGDSGALERLMPLVEGELKRIARSRLRRLRRQLGDRHHRADLDTTALLDEALLRLVGDRRGWQNRAHFFAIAAHRMRNVCTDYARAALAQKRGGADRSVPMEKLIHLADRRQLDPTEMLALDQALDRLADMDPRQARIVELRYFAGLTDAEVASTLGVSEATVGRDWRAARAWLYLQLGGAPRAGARGRSDGPR